MRQMRFSVGVLAPFPTFRTMRRNNFPQSRGIDANTRKVSFPQRLVALWWHLRLLRIRYPDGA